MLSFNRPQKNVARLKVIAHAAKLRNVKTALFLPSSECIDIKAALAAKLVSRKTFIIAVEKDESKCKDIFTFLKANFNDFYIHRGELYTLDLRHFAKLDFAFLDLCGDMTISVAAWLELFRSRCNVGAKVALTFTARPRNNHFIKDILNDFPEIDKINQWEYYGSKAIYWQIKNTFDVSGWFEYRDTSTPMIVFFANCNKLYNCPFTDDDFIEFKLKLFISKEFQMTTVSEIVSRFETAGDARQLAGAKRMATCYVQRRVSQGHDENRIKAAIRANLSRKGMKGIY